MAVSSIDSSIDIYEISDEIWNLKHLELNEGEPWNWKVDINNEGNMICYGTTDLFIDSTSHNDWREILGKQKFIQIQRFNQDSTLIAAGNVDGEITLLK